MNDFDALDDLLSRYHAWAKAYKANFQPRSGPMFRNAKSSRGWDTTADVIDEEVTNAQMEAVDFQVSEMRDPHRTCVYVMARNAYTGRKVWMSPRLPSDREELAVVIQEARNQIMGRLLKAGVL